MFLIEAVHSSNPISELRHLELQRMVSKSTAGCLFVSAFADAKTFARFSKQIGWETEVWIADDPDHMIHFDGGRFLKPYRYSIMKKSPIHIVEFEKTKRQSVSMADFEGAFR